jgi:3-hydroxybutyryl-CoA dehydratase
MELSVGQTASISKRITSDDVLAFAALSMDDNPIHVDEEAGKASIFKQRIAHGYYVASFISAVIARDLPGPGSIYLGQELSFRRPVFLGDTVTASVTVAELPKPGIVKLATVCRNQDDQVVIEGVATIKYSQN